VGQEASPRTAYLTHDQLATKPELARRLPFDLAWRYQALPLTEERGRVTVAVANPEDAQARDAILAALGPESCVVQGDPLTIEALLAKVWGDVACSGPNLRVCAFPGPVADDLWHYAEALGVLLGGHLSRVTTAEEVNAQTRDGLRACDLVILGENCHPLIRRVLSLPVAEGAASSGQSAAPFAVLAAQEPRWPLERILLLVSGVDADNAALDWALRLACPSTAAVTVLAVVPPVPAMYRGLSRMEQTLRSLLRTDTDLGCQMRRVAERLVASGVDSSLRLRQGGLEQQICREMAEREYDLAIMATNPCQWWLRQLKGDPICSLLRWARWPVLFVEPTTE
jgi:nucleotide-binding universal stress UspA family protein